MPYYPERSLPRIHVVQENGKVSCFLDEKLLQRFGPVLYENNLQGRHLFSISYCILSMALKFHGRPEKEVLDEIRSQFHLDFITMLVINAMYVGTVTHFINDWEEHFDQLMLEYQSLQNGDFDLETYLNLVGAMLHTFPCNVAFSKNASDPHGGSRAKEAIDKIRKITSKKIDDGCLNANISLTLDMELIDELFAKGFDDNMIPLLAFMIMQIIELQSLTGKRSDLESNKIAKDVFEIAFMSRGKISRGEDYSKAVVKAIELIKLTKREIKMKLESGSIQSIRNHICKETRRVYHFN